MTGISTLIKHWDDYGSDSIGKLIGRTITAIWISEDRVTFATDAGELTWRAEGDCCSTSYLYSIEGVDRLLAGHPVVAVHSIELQPGDTGYHDPDCARDSWREPAACGVDHDVLQVYGYRFTTEDPKWGPVSSVLSFRNDSNGYYGGWLEFTEDRSADQQQITADWITDDAAGVKA